MEHQRPTVARCDMQGPFPGVSWGVIAPKRLESIFGPSIARGKACEMRVHSGRKWAAQVAISSAAWPKFTDLAGAMPAQCRRKIGRRTQFPFTLT